MQLQPVLPVDRFNTLQLAVHDACVAATATLALQTDVYSVERIRVSRLDRNNPTVTVFSLVLDAVWIALQNYAQEKNVVHSAATHVAPEILSAIFAYLSFKDRISTSHVSHRWRDASLAFPARLWSTIPHTTRLQHMDSLLARTGARGLPVDLAYTYGGKSYRHNRKLDVDALSKHMVHICSLKLCIKPCNLNPHDAPELPAALRTAAPLLRRFYMVCNPSMMERDRLLLSQGIFSGQAPLLEHIELQSCDNCLKSFRRFTSIRSVTLTDKYLYSDSPLWKWLLAFPLLETLETSATTYYKRDARKIALPAGIMRLAISVGDEKIISSFNLTRIDDIQRICISAIQTERVNEGPSCVGAREAQRFLPNDFHPHSLVATYDRAGDGYNFWSRKLSFSVQGRSDGSDTTTRKTRSFINIDCSALSHPPIWKSTFGRASRLVLYFSDRYNSTHWPTINSAVCENAEELTIQRFRWYTRQLSESEPIPGGMMFPRLRTLKLLTTYAGESSTGNATRPTVAFDALTEMVRGLGCAAPTLERLCLCGLDVLPRSALLSTIADDVRFEEGRAEVPDWQYVEHCSIDV